MHRQMEVGPFNIMLQKCQDPTSSISLFLSHWYLKRRILSLAHIIHNKGVYMTYTQSPVHVTLFQNTLTGDQLHGTCNTFCHEVENALQWTRTVFAFKRVLLPGKKIRWGNKIGAYIALL